MKAELLEQKAALVAYLLSKVKASDWHAVQDAASDIREIDAKMSVLPAMDPASGAPMSDHHELRGSIRCPLGHFMLYSAEDDRFHCRCGAVASAHGKIIVDPDPVEVS